MSDIIYHPYISEALISQSFGFTEEAIETPSGPKIKLTMEGEFQRADAPNKNKRVYPEEILVRETQKIAQLILERNGHPMGMDHPIPKQDDPNAVQMMQRIDMENACALTTHLEMSNKVVYGKSQALIGDHSTGDKLAAYVRAGFKPAVSSRGVGGNPSYNPQGWMVIPENYNIICWDFVSNPSVHNAILATQLNEEFFLFEQASKSYKSKFTDVLLDLSKKYSGK